MSTTRERAARCHVGCDHCDAGAWIGARAGGVDAWCESCQRPTRLSGLTEAGSTVPCPACGAPLSTGSLRSEELYGKIQHLAAVLAAWAGDAAPLGALLPDRPRFLTDLTPPAARAGDDPDTARALHALAAGSFADARVRLERLLARAPDEARLWRALAVAHERLGEPGPAERAWTRVLERGEAPVARLARGALRARRGEHAGARADLGRAGDGFEARWNRAALIVLEAVARSPGLPDAETLARARAEAGEASPYWSSPTVGRLLWTALIERALHAPARSTAGAHAARSAGESPAAPETQDDEALRAAERQLEFDTFWDRALVVHGYAAAGMPADAARAGAALAGELADRLALEPALAGHAARPIAERARAAVSAIRDGDPEAARAALEPLLERPDLRRYRMPCAHCGQGTIGVDQVEDETGD